MRKVLVLLLAALGLVAACMSKGDTGSAPDGPAEVGSIAPAFTLPSAQSGPVALADHLGRPVLLYFSMGPG